MPYYEYECTECGKKFEVRWTFREYDEHPVVRCPKCASKAVEQLVASVSVQTPKKS